MEGPLLLGYEMIGPLTMQIYPRKDHMSSAVKIASSWNSNTNWYIQMQFLFFSDDCFKLGNVMMKDVWQNKENHVERN